MHVSIVAEFNCMVSIIGLYPVALGFVYPNCLSKDVCRKVRPLLKVDPYKLLWVGWELDIDLVAIVEGTQRAQGGLSPSIERR